MSLPKNKYLAIIPARCGSKGIKKKNIVDVNGKPLIEYTIKPAVETLKKRIVEKVIVSTDCKEIKKICEDLGAEVPFLRPIEISGDKAKSISYILHALDFFEKRNQFFDAVIILQPTAPLRTENDIEEAINLFEANPKSESLISCYREEYINDLVTYRKENNFAIPINPNHNKGVRRQEHGSIFVRNGAIYITTVKYLKNTKQVISDKPLMYEIPKSRSLNIDTLEDLKILRKFL
ncbi:MAG: cytidylyltransferase domain-containing protein [Promethearchaeota archaeon]